MISAFTRESANAARRTHLVDVCNVRTLGDFDSVGFHVLLYNNRPMTSGSPVNYPTLFVSIAGGDLMDNDPRSNLAIGTQVRFMHRGELTTGKVTFRHLDPNRKPGLGRVSYDIEYHWMFVAVRKPATKIEVVVVPSIA